MRLFILGATGVTGGTELQLTKEALQQGHAVTVFARSPEKMRRAHVRGLGVVSMAFLFPDVGVIGPVLRYMCGLCITEDVTDG